MGMTYTICYCRDGSKCKAMASEKDKFDEKHWSEVKESLQLYLKEPVCVPGATDSDPVPASVHQVLVKYMKAIAESRTHHFSGDYALWHQRRVETAQALAKLSALPQEFLSTAGLASRGTRDIPVPTSVDAVELNSSVQNKEKIHIYHHFSFLMDIVAEMHSLAIQATAHISTENLLPVEHPHRVTVEKRQQEHSVKTQ